jgi:hypothetical protein
VIVRIVRGKSSPHRPMRRVHAVLTVLACLLILPAAAGASGRSVVRDCTDNGQIDSSHSQSDYKDALHSLPSDVNEYTDCRQIIEQSKRRDARKSDNGSSGSGGGGTGGSGSFSGFDTPTPPAASNVPSSPAETGALAQAANGGAAAVPVAGDPITPGGAGLTEAAFRHDVPGPLLALVILLGLGALATTVSGARARGLHAPGVALRAFDRVFPRRA